MLAFASLLAVLPIALAAPTELLKRATDINGSPVGFKLPVPRGWADATDSKSPCGGFAANGSRTNFPMTGGDISLLTKADGDQVQINVARTSEATRNANFRSLVHEIAVTYRGHQCLEAPDMASLGFAAGDQVTLQLTYLAGTGNTKLYQCADVILVANDAFVPAEGAFCVNGAYDYASPDERNYADSSSGLTTAQKGGIGAGVSVGALLLLGLAAFLYKRTRTSKVAPSGASIDGRTLQGDSASLASRDMSQKMGPH